MKGRKIELNKMKIKNKEKGITLTALAITIIILLILAGATINLTIGDEGIFTRAIDAQDRYKAEEIIEKMQIIKANTIIDDKGKFDKDDFFNNLVEEGIVGDREEIIDNGDGSYTITTEEGYVIDIIEKDEGKDVEIEYVGKGEKIGPRIKEIHVRNKTTNAIEIEVEASNANGAKYTYSYKLEDEEEYKEAAKGIEENTYKYENLEANKIYNIKVEVENRGIKKEKVINVRTGELPEGAISIGEVVWENGKAKVEVNINKEIEGNLKLEYKINEEGIWTEIQDGGIIENLEHNQTVYVRLTDGTNETEYLSTKIEDNIAPEVNISLGTITSNSIQVQVTAQDNETGLADTNAYEYYLDNVSKGTSNGSTYTFSNLLDGREYTLKVAVTDKAGNANEAEIKGTTKEVTSGLVEGAITFTNPTWTNGTASIQVSTNTSYQIEYQLNGTEGTWTKIENGGTISSIPNNTTIYARLTDGINAGEYATASIKDTTKPTVSIKTGTITSNSIQVTATASDGQTGLATSNTYEYFLNGTSKGKSTSNSYTYSGLADGTKYTLKVKVLDKAGNSNEASTTGTTSTVPAGTVSGAITFTSPTWSNGTASIKVSTNTSYQIEYQKNSTTGTWTKISIGGTISGLSHNTTVYARLTDGANAGGYASTSIKDTVAPTVSISTSNITTNSVKLAVTASDNQSGLADSGRYTYYLNTTQKASNNTNSYTYTGLSANTSYTLKVIVKDKAGKTAEKSTTIKTLGISATEVDKSPSTYYGAKVTGYTCSSSGVSTWRIFYADSTNIYLIADDYISHSNIPTVDGEEIAIETTNEYKLSFYSSSYYNNPSNWININSKGKKWLNQYISSTYRGFNNMKATAFLMDTNAWSIYAGEKAEYAMGAPTIELFCASYKDTHPNKYVECSVLSDEGYGVKFNTDSSYRKTFPAGSLIKDDFNSIYVKSNAIKASGMHLASPASRDSKQIFAITSGGGIYANQINLTLDAGLRPIVCLKSGTVLTKTSEGVYAIQ